MSDAGARRPKLAVWKFASCDGCQLSLLDLEDELLALAGAVQLAEFREATSGVVAGPYDLSLVEGSITTPHDAERIQDVRRASRALVTIGACATAGGIQALRNFADVREFVAAVDHGSLRAGARRVGVSQPAMSKSLRQLEEELQTRLLVRSARGVMLTPAGRAFLARARVIQAELRRVQDDLLSLRGAAGGSVAIGIAPPISLLLPEAIARFREKYPAARVRIVEGVRTAVLPAVRDETLDFAVGQNPGGTPESGLRFRPLLRPQLVVAGRKGHPLARARSLRELAGASWLIFNPLGSGGMLERAFASVGIATPNALVHCESYATALALMARSDVLGLLFEHVFTDPLAARYFHRFEIEESIATPSLGLYLRADTPLTPAAAAMAQAVTATLRALARRPA